MSEQLTHFCCGTDFNVFSIRITEKVEIVNEDFQLEFLRGSDAEIYCDTKGNPVPFIEWFVRTEDDDEFHLGKPLDYSI